MYTYTPNAFAIKEFGLTERSYHGNGLSALLTDSLGKENSDKLVVAQDPFCGGVTQNDVFILVNPNEPRADWQYNPIGMVFKGRVIIEPEKAP